MCQALQDVVLRLFLFLLTGLLQEWEVCVQF